MQELKDLKDQEQQVKQKVGKLFCFRDQIGYKRSYYLFFLNVLPSMAEFLSVVKDSERILD